VIYRDNFRVCAGCGQALKETRAVGHHFERCDGCGGTWLPLDQLACMTIDLVGHGEEVADGTGAAAPQACPSCGAAMRPCTYAGVSALHCGDHGIWFARGALERALEAVQQS
jgi:Zn-finger nucleic acid-binding protein